MEDQSFSVLLSQRLSIRCFQAADASAFAAYRSDPEVARYQGWEAPYSLERAIRFIESLEGASPGVPGSWFQFAVALNPTDLLIGDCGLCPTRRDPSQAELDFTFAKAYQGKGYASEAVRRLLEYLFTSLALRRVYAITQIQNSASNRLLKRTGFDWKGHFIEESSDEGDTADEYKYELLREDWENHHAS
jgi:aminoglycoside 6'-N-acetyltransferase